MVLLIIDAVALGLATFAMDIITVTLLALAFLPISASVLEEGFPTYLMWAVDVALLGTAVLANSSASPTRAAGPPARNEGA